MESMRDEMICLQGDVDAVPEEESLLIVKNLDDYRTQLETNWYSTKEEMRKAGEPDSSQHKELE